MNSESTKSAALAVGGLAAVLASACCLGPLVLIAVGLGGAWIGSLTKLEPYRPIFLSVAVVALFLAWRRIYRSPAACNSGDVCALPQTKRLYKFLFWVVSSLVLIALSFPFFVPLFY